MKLDSGVMADPGGEGLFQGIFHTYGLERSVSTYPTRETALNFPKRPVQPVLAIEQSTQARRTSLIVEVMLGSGGAEKSANGVGIMN